MDPGSAKLDMVNTVDAHANTPQKRKRCPDEASAEPWSVAKSDMTVTSDMGRWEKADLDDSQNEELLTEDLEDLLDEAYGRRPTPTPTPSPPSWVAPLQEDQGSQVLADLSKPANPTEAVSINSPEATTSRNALLDHLEGAGGRGQKHDGEHLRHRDSRFACEQLVPWSSVFGAILRHLNPPDQGH